LEQSLLGESPEILAAAAVRKGDPARGAVVFFRAEMACHRCHSVGESGGGTAPDLTRLDKNTGNAALVTSVLKPSETISAGFEATALELSDGRTLIGTITSETADNVTLRDASQPETSLVIPKRDIEARKRLANSIMPAGQVNQLASRQEFLDLVRYLMELRDGGPLRARELQPAPEALALKLPDYEKHVDHAAMIRGLGDENHQRGAAVYQRHCQNCHGTREEEGSLPTALRFASGRFKNGSDPHAMYQTVTRGYGMMTPQTSMVPRQKYDVIHYIRETFLKKDNPTQYFAVTDSYLAALPRGNTQGPEPKPNTPWLEMDYGPALTNVYEFGTDGSNLAYKGIAVRLDAGAGGVTHGTRWMVFDHDTFRVAGAWHGQGFIDFAGIQFDGQHVVHAHTVGTLDFVNPPQPGWGRPEDGSFDDPRMKGTDGKQYGPLPREWGLFRGVYHHGPQVVIAYRIGTTDLLELPGMCTAEERTAYTRTLNLSPRRDDLVLQVAHLPKGELRLSSGAASDSAVAVLTSGSKSLVTGAAPFPSGARWTQNSEGNLRLRLPKGDVPLRLTVWIAATAGDHELARWKDFKPPCADRDLAELTRGGPPRWPERLTAQPQIGLDNGPFAVDVLKHPDLNPWQAQMRFTGLDFLDADRAALCTWDGDVWVVSGLSKPAGPLTWQRIGSGLFQPLGLKVIRGRLFVACRDQIVILNDLNGDGETDFYESFNSDHQVTAHFHEFAMGLQVDGAGNLYYSKAACHARPYLVPQHGTLLRVSADGRKTDILAHGFRAPNGVCLNPDGSFFLTDQEGHWLPKNRINRVVPGGFYGNMLGASAPQDSSDNAMQQPVCWITNAFDRSPAEMLWINSDAWGPLKGSLLNLSYGYGKFYVVPHEEVHGQWQGGMCELAIPALPTGVIRGRFSPYDGQLYSCGMYAWAGSRTQPGGFYRIRATGEPAHVPVQLKARRGRIEMTLSDPVDSASAAEVKNYRVRVWSLRRTANYGSKHHDERELAVSAARLSADGKTIVLTLPKLAPTWCMEIAYDLKTQDGKSVAGRIHNTIHALRE